jgi:hypothetical protein
MAIFRLTDPAADHILVLRVRQQGGQNPKLNNKG